ASFTSSSVASLSFQKSNNTAKSSTAPATRKYISDQYSLFFMSFRIDVARALSSQNPGDRDSCLSFVIFAIRLS
ncbi:MAG: hypothetical protein NT127_07840, partial [Sphingobacteriales bacterium]|nr:hypothetical protein [Sphingobacteriales bacterium]